MAHWRGNPLPDLHAVPEAAVELDRVRAGHTRTLVELGEPRLVAGDPAEAARLAGRAPALEPYDARAHRLSLAAAVKSHDPARVGSARATVLDALAELGTPPDPTTELLLRRTSPG